MSVQEESIQQSEERQQEPHMVEEDDLQKMREFREAAKKKGVCYISRIPPYMTPNFVRKLLKEYGIERIYLMPEDESLRLHRKKTGGNKRQSFTQGWVEFTDKKVARMVAEALNCQKMVSKKGSFYSEDLWNIKYLPKFKWENLTAKLAYDARIKKQRLKMEFKQDARTQEFYSEMVEKGKNVVHTIRSKKIKGRKITEPERARRFVQRELMQEGDN